MDSGAESVGYIGGPLEGHSGILGLNLSGIYAGRGRGGEGEEEEEDGGGGGGGEREGRGGGGRHFKF